MTAGPAPCPPATAEPSPRSHGNEISLAIQILTPFSLLILILISSYLISHLINALSVSYLQLSYFLVYSCRRTTFSLSSAQGLLLSNRRHAIHRPCSSVPRGCCLCCSYCANNTSTAQRRGRCHVNPSR
ncbi:hypothetical protein F5882DRAFT_518097 [Hyaloscypha sp. PMI_1271]|nr:hypothetical protein F5882DRAFT_518097 [Hyaloscypha sp. PMI_1271]